MLLDAAKRAVREGGAMGAVLNAANEVAVGAFLGGKIGFVDIFDAVLETLDRLADKRRCTTLEDILLADVEARELCTALVDKISLKR